MISELLAYDFMQRAILAVIAISIFSPILGLFLILRRQSLMSDTLSHVSLAGVAVGIFLGQSTTWMTLVVVVIAALVLEYLRVSYKHYMEISTAILMSMGLAVALILSNKAGSSSMSLDSYLFGSIITISSEQVRALFVIAAIVLVLTLLFIRPMYLLTFDEDTAHVDGLPVRLMSLLFNIVTGIAIALMIPAAGSLLVSTIMILPAAIGMKIGDDCIVYVPTKTLIDEQYPWMISIGNHVRIIEGVKILTHDYSWSVLKNYRGGVFGASGIVEIGDNVFIGMNAIIERNVKIGNNVVIGAGSIVTKDCEENSVYAGVPAKRIMNIDEFLMKRRDKQLDEAKLLARRYYERYRKMPEPAVFHEYFMLFETSESVTNNTVFEKKIRLGDSEEQTFLYMKEHAPKFKSYDEFMKYCFEQENNER